MVAALAAFALLPAARAGAGLVHERRAGPDRAALDAYWTRERLRSAEARQLPLRASGAAPGAPSEAHLREPYGTYEVADPKAFPNRITGRVFARDAGGDYSCSATVVRSRTRSALFTAAHCVRTRRLGWARRFVFIPAYRNGGAPFGRWQWRTLYLPRDWASFRFDYAVVRLARLDGRSVQGRVGAARLATRARRGGDYRALGYPLNFFSGRRMMGCLSPFSRTDRTFGAPEPIGIECEMTAGASGGGWLIGGPRLVSVTSYGIRNQPGILYGPDLTRRAAKLLRFAERDRDA